MRSIRLSIQGKEQEEEVGQGSKSCVLSWALKTFDPITTTFLPSLENVSHRGGGPAGGEVRERKVREQSAGPSRRPAPSALPETAACFSSRGGSA